MENKTEQMTGEESLRIITEMIQKTRCNIKNGSFHLLLWGWLVLICSLSEYLLWQLSSFEKPYMIWLLSIPAVFVSLIYGYRKGRAQTVYTYADRIYMWTWLAFLVSATILIVLLIANDTNYFGSFILLLAGLPTFLSGVIIRFRPLVIGGIAFWVLALLGHFLPVDIAPLSVPFAMLVGYLIPGYILRKEENNDTV